MAIEIERKFLVLGDSWRSKVNSRSLISQGYLSRTSSLSIRVRVMDENGFLTIKNGPDPLSRLEFEYPIPLADAEELLSNLCDQSVLRKTRHIIPMGAVNWEVDEFEGLLQGLLLAEVELPFAEFGLEFPKWIGREVTHDSRYLNVNLAEMSEPPVL
jgi:adenylate cyclase